MADGIPAISRVFDPEAISKAFSRPDPWLMRFVKQVGRGINRFGMIKDGDRIVLGVSSGKDSLVMAFALALRLKWLPIKYELFARQVDWRQYPAGDAQAARLEEYFGILGIPFQALPTEMFPPSFKGRFDCYLCARNRKRVLFDEAAKLGANKVGLGHHLDDIVLTTMMNMSFRGRFSTMMPYQEFFGGKLHVVRPMCEVRESSVKRTAERLCLPVADPGCPFKETNMRLRLKPVLAELSKINTLVRENMYASLFNVDTEYLPAFAGKETREDSGEDPNGE